MKKDNNLLKFTSFVLLVTIIALILVAGTFAKYTSEATGTATATVAKWEILAGVEGEEVDISGSNQTIAFNLFDTIEEENGGEELDVLTDETGKVIRIAPGTSGSFDLSIVNNSEVTAAYTIDFEVDRTDIPLQYSTDGGANWYSNLENVTETIIPMDDATTTDIDESKTVVNVQWKWAFEGDDVLDTSLGIEAPEITVKATLNVVQHDASEAPIVDFEQYTATTVSLGNPYVLDMTTDESFMSISENLFLNAYTEINLSDDSGTYTLYVYRQGSRDIVSTDSETETMNGTSVTISESDWYGIAIKSNSGTFDSDASTTLGNYVSFVY